MNQRKLSTPNIDENATITVRLLPLWLSLLGGIPLLVGATLHGILVIVIANDPELSRGTPCVALAAFLFGLGAASVLGSFTQYRFREMNGRIEMKRTRWFAFIPLVKRFDITEFSEIHCITHRGDMDSVRQQVRNLMPLLAAFSPRERADSYAINLYSKKLPSIRLWPVGESLRLGTRIGKSVMGRLSEEFSAATGMPICEVDEETLFRAFDN